MESFTSQAITFVGVTNAVDKIWVNWLLRRPWPWGTLAMTSPTPSGFWYEKEVPEREPSYSGWSQAAGICLPSSGHCPCGSHSRAVATPSALTCSHPFLITSALNLPRVSFSSSASHLKTSSEPLTIWIPIFHHSTPYTSQEALIVREGVPPRGTKIVFKSEFSWVNCLDSNPGLAHTNSIKRANYLI